MGITISLRGKLREAGMVRDITDEVEEFAELLGWKQETVTDNTVQGVCITPPDCETLMLTFDVSGTLRNPILLGSKHDEWVGLKTQYGSVDTHIAVCGLLKHLESKYFGKLEVCDDGGYWDSGDRELLEERLHMLGAAIDRLGMALGAARITNFGDTPESMIGSIEQIARETLGTDIETRAVVLDRVNGPWPPFTGEAQLDWELDRWIDFWEDWDAHRSPVLAFMRGLPETISSLEEALLKERERRRQMDADLATLLAMMDEPDDRPGFDWRVDEARDDMEEWEKALEERGEEIDFILEEDTESRSSIYETAMQWWLQACDATAARENHPVVRYMASAVPPVLVGIRMAEGWRRDEDMFLAVTARCMVCARRFATVSRLFMLVPDAPFPALSASAMALSEYFAQEADGG